MFNYSVERKTHLVEGGENLIKGLVLDWGLNN